MKDDIISSWNNEDPALYGRFDSPDDGKSPAKLYEFNGILRQVTRSKCDPVVVACRTLINRRPVQFIHEKLMRTGFIRPS